MECVSECLGWTENHEDFKTKMRTNNRAEPRWTLARWSWLPLRIRIVKLFDCLEFSPGHASVVISVLYKDNGTGTIEAGRSRWQKLKHGKKRYLSWLLDTHG